MAAPARNEHTLSEARGRGIDLPLVAMPVRILVGVPPDLPARAAEAKRTRPVPTELPTAWGRWRLPSSVGARATSMLETRAPRSRTVQKC